MEFKIIHTFFSIRLKFLKRKIKNPRYVFHTRGFLFIVGDNLLLSTKIVKADIFIRQTEVLPIFVQPYSSSEPTMTTIMMAKITVYELLSVLFDITYTVLTFRRFFFLPHLPEALMVDDRSKYVH